MEQVHCGFPLRPVQRRLYGGYGQQSLRAPSSVRPLLRRLASLPALRSLPGASATSCFQHCRASLIPQPVTHSATAAVLGSTVATSHRSGHSLPNNSFKPTPLRYANHMAGTACHVLRSTTRRGLTQALGRMTKSMSIFDFLKTSTWLARLCLLVAALSLLAAIYSWLPLVPHYLPMLFGMHLATMAVLFCVFVLLTRHHFTAFRLRRVAPFKVFFPAGYWFALLAAFAYFLVVFIGGAIYYPHGVDLGPTVSLRIFASGWLFLSLAAVGFAQWAGLRLRALNDAA